MEGKRESVECELGGQGEIAEEKAEEDEKRLKRGSAMNMTGSMDKSVKFGKFNNRFVSRWWLVAETGHCQNRK